MYPDLPYPGYTWHITHHMGVLDERNLYNILWAALTYANSRDPDAEINNYIIANRLVSNDVRQDTGQPAAWRDYQQMLSQLGLMFSDRVVKNITLTPLGLAYLDKALDFSEVVTLQAFRYQYPNGHNLAIDKDSLGARLVGTPLESIKPLPRLQMLAGVDIQPAILIWKILRGLQARGESVRLSVDEIQSFALRCSTNVDSDRAVDAIVNFRRGGLEFDRPKYSRRNTQEWIKFLLKTPIFEGQDYGRNQYVQMSSYGAACADQIDNICLGIEQDITRWTPGILDKDDKLRWYAWYGSIDLEITSIPIAQQIDEPNEDEFGETDSTSSSQINLRSFDEELLATPSSSATTSRTAIELSYSLELSLSQRRLHDLMVALIANLCLSKGASVWDDPKTVDLLVRYQDMEFIIEVKTVTPRNFVNRIRYALGQILYYDYLRSRQSIAPRRKVIAIAANVADTSWCIPFLNGYMDIDLLSMRSNVLHVHSQMPITNQLFTAY